ncbi:RNA-guided pseudouridylation complex pseudouridine synthase subunit Cbf5 [Candidatus Pacearchaeota archaeon CG10_big_fil_rev_8_21_14_0_10_32_42]|nr:MAG: RNA-guided pseudouridylation complex pseudouridine synthase subunit Cbf5 [Candidatus Pacearchaeota archaeon CG10_big_fil_rev_8_21_14_0_10_32_42]
MKLDLEKIKSEKPIKELLEFSIINIDKPSGPTSFDVSDFVRKTLGLRKTSHFGTLDPMVTGVLPIALNRACKLTGFFLGEDKTYVGIARFHEEVSIEKLNEIINTKFLGKIKQTPPVKSRVKRVEREREIYSFKILEKNNKDFLFVAKVQGGTYIRKLIDDLGKELGIGGHMLELRRTNAGIYFEDDKNYPIVNLYDFEKAVLEYEKGNEEILRKILIPAEIVFEVYEPVFVKETNLKRIYTGKPIYFEDLEKKPKLEKGKVVSVFCERKFVGMYKVVNEGELFAKSEFVLQEIR